MARTFDSSQFSLQIDPSHKISKNLNFDPRAVALLRTFPRYQERLATFNAIKWHSKPPTLSPPFCALYGWHVTDFDVLRFWVRKATFGFFNTKFLDFLTQKICIFFNTKFLNFLTQNFLNFFSMCFLAFCKIFGFF